MLWQSCEEWPCTKVMTVICPYPGLCTVLCTPCAFGCSGLHSSPPVSFGVIMGLTAGVLVCFTQLHFLLTQLRAATLVVGLSMNCILLLLTFRGVPSSLLGTGEPARTDWGNRTEMQYFSNLCFLSDSWVCCIFLSAFPLIVPDFRSSAVELKLVWVFLAVFLHYVARF